MSGGLPQLEKGEAVWAVVVLTLGLAGLASTFNVEVLTDVVGILGLIVLLPLIAILGDRLPFVASDEDEVTASATDFTGTADDADDPIAKLRDRYARGEIDEREFERRLEGLLETEDIDSTVESGRDRIAETE